jgi:hypothetical protein
MQQYQERLLPNGQWSYPMDGNLIALLQAHVRVEQASYNMANPWQLTLHTHMRG